MSPNAIFPLASISPPSGTPAGLRVGVGSDEGGSDGRRDGNIDGLLDIVGAADGAELFVGGAAYSQAFSVRQ